MIVNKSVNVTRCIDCPNFQSTMDGMTCLEKEKEGAYKGLIITNQMEISKECPLI
jgi:hypothetical protein